MKAVLEHVNKSYNGVPVLQGVSMTLEGINVLMAPSGQGKTTLARLLLELEKPDSGRIKVDGKIAAQFQEDRLCPQLTAIQNILLVCSKSDDGRVRTALKTLGFLPEDMEKPAAQLSGGQARRVSLVRALLASADGVILDEPFKGLDESTRCKAMEWTRAVLAGRWLLLITHDDREAKTFGGSTLTWQ